jgi:hypothetical protein
VRHDACRWSLEACRGCAGPPGPDLAKRDLNPRIPARVMTISVRVRRCGGAGAREGVGRGEVAQVRHDACRWSLETCRGCAGPPGPDLAKRDLNPRIPARVMTISVRVRRCGGAGAREGVGRGEVAQVRHDACRWSLETCRGCAGPPGPDLAKRDLNPRIPARVMTISVRVRRCGDAGAREGVGRGEVAQVRHDACRWSLEACRGCAGPPGPDLAKRDLNPRIPARVMTISVRVRRCGGAGAREGVGRGEVAQVRHDACRWSLEACRGCAGPPGPDLAKRDLNPRIPARVMTISVRVRRCGGAGAREGVGRGEVAQVRHDACRWSLETCRGCAGPPGPDLAKRDLNPRIPARVMTISVRVRRCGGAGAREGVGRGEVAQVRHDACRWSLEACRGCAGPPGPDLAKRDLNPRIPARVMTISVRVRRCGGAGAREGVGRGEVAQVRHDACRWSLEACRGCAGPPGPDLAKRDLNPRIPARVMTISVRVRRCGGAGAREGVGRGEVAQVRHDACRWSLEACRGCAGPPGPDLAKRDLNPRIPARVMTISVRVRRCGGAGAREGVGRGEVAQVRHDACRWSLEACRGCAGPPGPDLAKRDLNPRIPARVMTISVRVRRCGGAGAREGVGRGEVAQVRHDACRWSLEACRGCAGPPGPDLAKRDLNPRIPARVMTISVRVRRCGGAGAREGVGRGEVAQVRHDACRWSLEACRGCAGPPGPDLAKRDLNPRIPARVMTISVRVRRCGGAGAREGVGRGEVAQVRHDACRWSLEACRGCAGPPGPDLAKRDLNPRIPARVMTISVRVRRCGGAGAREGVGRGEVAQVRHDACRWSLEACRGCAGPPGPDLAKRDLNPRIPARVMTICGGAGGCWMG